ncbi:MAG: hypothetical protein HOH95_11505 [Dehalococcoidia bacterium]|nr:hypothetical protein [Dehalococcoidia bacterium]
MTAVEAGSAQIRADGETRSLGSWDDVDVGVGVGVGDRVRIETPGAGGWGVAE